MGNVLQGKVALVTGSGQGVGRGIATFMAKEGAIVITNNRKKSSTTQAPAHLSEEDRKKYLAMQGDAESVAEYIRCCGGKAKAYFCDVSDYDAVGNMIDGIVSEFGRIDIVVNNAAITQAGGLMLLSESDWDKQTTVKMKGAFNCMRHAIPYMQREGGGRIINIASDAWVGLTNAAAYSAANAGMVGLTKSCAQELRRFGITCNAICPQAASPGHVAGFSKTLQTLETAMGKGFHMDEEKRKEVERNHGAPENAAPFIAYLASDSASDITGCVFSVTASGKIDYYTEPVRKTGICKNSGIWTLEELAEIVPTAFDALICKKVKEEF